MSGDSGAKAYAELAANAADSPLWERALQHQISLGDSAFAPRMQALAAPAGLTTRELPRPQRSRPLSLAQWLASCATRGEVFRPAQTCGGMSMSAIAATQGLSVARVSQLIGQAEMDFRLKT